MKAHYITFPSGIDGQTVPVFFDDIAARIRTERPDVLGKHIFVQLDALGLRREFDRGCSPCALPFSFAEAAK